MFSLLSSSGSIKWLIASLCIASATHAQVSPETPQEENSGPDLDAELNNALNITDRQNFVFNSSFVLSSSSCITPDGEKGECKAVSRCSNYTDRATRLDGQANVDFFRERICRLLHRTVHVCCPSEMEISPSEATQSQPLPDPSPETRQRPQGRPQLQPTPQPDPFSREEPEEPPRRQSDQPPNRWQPDPQSQPEEESPPQQQPEQPQQELPLEEEAKPQPVTESPSLIPSEAECGSPVATSRLPGDDVQLGNWPWLAVIGQKEGAGNDFMAKCSGTLITRRHILTIAHCFGENNPDTVILGEHHLENNDLGEIPEEYRIMNIRSNEYNSSSSENDIAILTLDRDVVFNDFIQPVCLPFNQTKNDYVGDSLTLVGWQFAKPELNETSKIPVETNVPILDSIQCTEAFQNVTQNVTIDSRVLCTSSDGSNNCIGDSGSTLNYLDPENGNYYLVGIASYEYECPASGLPGVYMRVGSFLDWIQQNL